MPQETVTENLQANLERASQLHENELVIELGIDRFLKWLGVYTILVIALVAKISEFTGPSTSCYPAYNTSGYDRKFIEYATSFCWESVTTSDITTPEGCLVEDVKSNTKLLPNPKAAIYFIRWLPQVMLVQAFLFAVPSICWHFVVGGRLVGHVRFIQLLLNDMYEAFRKLPTAEYGNKPYDKSSECFNGFRKRQKRTNGSETLMVQEQKEQPNLSPKEDVKAATPEEDVEAPTAEEDVEAPTAGEVVEAPTAGEDVEAAKLLEDVEANNAPKNFMLFLQIFFFKSKLVGDLKDRHLFSMLCYENFSSLSYLPYILSVFHITKDEAEKKRQEKKKKEEKKKGGNEGKEEKQIIPMQHGMLKLWCNENNLGGTFLVKAYVVKHCATLLLSIALLISFAAWASADGVLQALLGSSNTYTCKVAFQDVCMVCVVNRAQEIMFMFICDLIITIFIMVLSLGWVIFFRMCSIKRVMCYFFEHLTDTCTLAFLTLNSYMKGNNDE
ncbi:uncharacterized protein LOC100178110 [Ciona intestinalis]